METYFFAICSMLYPGLGSFDICEYNNYTNQIIKYIFQSYYKVINETNIRFYICVLKFIKH